MWRKPVGEGAKRVTGGAGEADGGAGAFDIGEAVGGAARRGKGLSLGGGFLVALGFGGVLGLIGIARLEPIATADATHHGAD